MRYDFLNSFAQVPLFLNPLLHHLVNLLTCSPLMPPSSQFLSPLCLLK